MSKPVIEPLRDPAPRIADAAAGLRHVFVRDLVVACNIGIHQHEKAGPQRVRISVDLGVLEGRAPHEDRLENVVCYEEVVTRVRGIVAETLAERIASVCLQNPNCRSARVRVEKLDVFADASGAGVEIERLSNLPLR
jgi:7,8-dihydroneopterin aldolase/epimerase/oxygenase